MLGDETGGLRRSPSADLRVFARWALADPAPRAHEAALLLEGSWPEQAPPWHESLDDRVDARFEWIDLQADHWAEQLGSAPPGESAGDLLDEVTAGYLNARSLRYYLVKLLRIVAYLTEIRPVEPGDRLELVAARNGDEDYAELLSALAGARGASLRVSWRDRREARHPPAPPNGRPRRWAGALGRWLEPPAGGSESGHRTVLCGDPRLLDPVCGELLRRRGRVWWLFDRFAVGAWLKWRRAGVGQLVCDSSTGRRNLLGGRLPEALLCRGVDLVPAVGRWLVERMRAQGRAQTRMIEAIDAHFRRVRPDTLVVCEDATPFSRAAVAVARRHGATSLVVQHGAPACRFGYAPLAADRFLAWDDASKRQLIGWGVPAERIEITGSPQHDAWLASLRRQSGRVVAGRLRVPPRLNGARHSLLPWTGNHRPKVASPAGSSDRPVRILLLGTVPPEDNRPDSIALHLTRRSYAQMLQAAFAAVARRPGAKLAVKPHPRAASDPILDAVRRAHRGLPVEFLRRGSAWELCLGADCVLSLLSTAGIEAALAGAPVIQLLPSGSGDVLSHDGWGLVGSARSQTELERLLDDVLAGRWQPGQGIDVDQRVAPVLEPGRPKDAGGPGREPPVRGDLLPLAWHGFKNPCYPLDRGDSSATARVVDVILRGLWEATPVADRGLPVGHSATES